MFVWSFFKVLRLSFKFQLLELAPGGTCWTCSYGGWGSKSGHLHHKVRPWCNQADPQNGGNNELQRCHLKNQQPELWHFKNEKIKGLMEKIHHTNNIVCGQTVLWATSMGFLYHIFPSYLTKNVPSRRTGKKFFGPISILCISIPAPPAWKPRLQVLDHSCTSAFGNGCSGWTVLGLTARVSHLLSEERDNEHSLKITNENANEKATLRMLV